MVAVVQARIPDVTLLNRDVDPHTVSVLTKMLERDPNNRFQSCDALLAALGNKARLQATPLLATELIAPLPPIFPPALPPMPPPPGIQNTIVRNAPHIAQASSPANARNLLPWGIGLAAFAIGGYFVVANLTPSDERSPKRPGEIEQQSEQITSPSAEPTEAAAASPIEPTQKLELGRAGKSSYAGSNLPNTQASGSAAGTELSQELLGKYAAETEDDDKASLIIDSLGARVGDEVSGYLRVGDVRTKLSGRVIDLQSEQDSDGDSWRVYSLTMTSSEGGELIATLKHSDENIAGTLRYTSSSGEDSGSFDVVDFDPNLPID